MGTSERERGNKRRWYGREKIKRGRRRLTGEEVERGGSGKGRIRRGEDKERGGSGERKSGGMWMERWGCKG